MATIKAASIIVRPKPTVSMLLAGRPMIALVAVLLTTGGHTMNLREMGVSQGWVAAEVYSLQSCYLVSLALAILAAPYLGLHGSYRRLTELGLMMAVAGSLLNVADTTSPLYVYLFGRAVAGAGAGLVIYFVPQLLDVSWRGAVASAVILCPVAGPGAVSLATMLDESSDWRHGFIFEGAAAAVGLIALLSMDQTHRAPARPPRESALYLLPLTAASAALFFILHWGQLHGWLESPDVLAAAAGGAAALAWTLWLILPRLDWGLLREDWARLSLFFFGGMCQFFHGYIMNVYGGTLVNLSSWQRAWLIWPMPIGAAASLALSHVRWRGRRVAVLGLPGAVVGLLTLAAGLFMSYQEMMEWPYWDVRDVMDLNWFTAPGQWELAPGRFLMGLGIGLFMTAEEAKYSPRPEREARVRPLLNVAQFYGGGLAAAILINFLIIGHKVHYSYSADRDTIQAEELSRRMDLVAGTLSESGQPAPIRSAEVLLHRFINYEADNLVFATIYVAFFFSTMTVAALFLAVWIWRRRRSTRIKRIRARLVVLRSREGDAAHRRGRSTPPPRAAPDSGAGPGSGPGSAASDAGAHPPEPPS